MHIRITCVTDEKAGILINDTLIELQDSLNLYFIGQKYGAHEQFLIVVVAVDSDASENEKFLKRYNKVGSYKNLVTSEMTKYIGFGIPFDPLAIERMGGNQFRIAFCDALLLKLENPEIKVPKTFEYDRFAADLKIRLEIFKRAAYI